MVLTSNIFFLKFQKVSTIQTYLSVFYLSSRNFNSISHFLCKLGGSKKNVGNVDIWVWYLPLSSQNFNSISYFLWKLRGSKKNVCNVSIWVWYLPLSRAVTENFDALGKSTLVRPSYIPPPPPEIYWVSFL